MGSLWGITHDIKDYFSLKERNDSLVMENFRLDARIKVLESHIEEAAMATGISKMSKDGGYSYMPAEIEKISNNTQHNYVIISKGRKDGVEKGAGLITRKGAIGVIDAVSDNFSYARSFKNHGMSISARLGKEGFAGPLVWDGIHSNGALLKEIPHHVSFSPGDTVYTSGYSSIFPPDIPLGITGRSRIVNGSSFEIEVELFEDFGALRYVTVVINTGKQEIKSLEGKR